MTENKNINIISNIIDSIVNNFEKLFRLLIPGTLLIFFLHWSINIKSTFDVIFKIDLVTLITHSFFFGIAVYAIHRTFFYIFDLIPFFIRRFKNKENKIIESFAMYLKNVSKIDDKISKTLFIRGATIHLAAIIFELIILFFIYNGIQNNLFIFILSLIALLLISIIHIFSVRFSIEIVLSKKPNNGT